MTAVGGSAALALGRSAALAVGLVALLSGVARALPDDGPRIYVDPPQVEGTTGAFTLALRVENAPATSGFSVDVLFDAKRLALTGVDLGPWPSSTGRAVQPLGPTVSAGRLAVGALMIGNADAPVGSGVLATLAFAPLGSGTSEIELASGQLVADDRSAAETSVSGAAVSVAQDPSESEVEAAAAAATAFAAAPRTGLVDEFVAAVESNATRAAPARENAAATAVASFTPISGPGGSAGSGSSRSGTVVVLALAAASVIFAWALVRRGGA